MFDAVEGMLAEHHELEGKLAAPETHADARLAKRLNQRYAQLSSVIAAWRDWQRVGEDLGAARELGAEDPAFARFEGVEPDRADVAMERTSPRWPE